MKLEVTADYGINLREVFSGVLLTTEDGEEMGICMRDSGFEFSYQHKWYSAQKGKITEMGLQVPTLKERSTLTGQGKPCE